MHPSKLKTIYLSLLIAFMAYLLPWSGFMLKFRPDFVLLMLIFWLVRAPNLCNIGTAWLLGLMVDLVTGGTFGQYALAYTVAAFFAVYYQRRLVLFNGTQQIFYVFALLLIAQITLLTLKAFTGVGLASFTYFLPSISGVVVWKIVIAFGLNTGIRAGVR